MSQEAPLADRRALVTGGDQGYGRALLDALRAAGARAEATPLADTSRSGVHAAFEDAAAALGGLDAVVHAQLAPALLEPRPLCETPARDWDAECEGALRTAIFVLQASHAQLRERGGRIVLVSPSVSTAGAAGLVPLTTAVEAIRVLAKAAAKQWGTLGITINSLAPGLEALGAKAPRVSLGEPALPDYDPRADVAPVVTFLAGAQSGTLTGATLRVDGGIWTPG